MVMIIMIRMSESDIVPILWNMFGLPVLLLHLILNSIVAGLSWISRKRRQISLHIGASMESKSKPEIKPETSTIRDESSPKGGVVKIEPLPILNNHPYTNRFIGVSSFSSFPATTTTTTTSTTPTTIAQLVERKQ